MFTGKHYSPLPGSRQEQTALPPAVWRPAIAGLLLGVAFLSPAPAPADQVSRLSPEVEERAATAIERGLRWLAGRQDEETGAWSNQRFPALTALPLWAFANAGEYRQTQERAVDFLLANVREDGGIYQSVPGRKGGGLGLYNTAICMTALHAVGRPDLSGVVLDARRYIAGSQHFGDDAYSGGFGYDRETERAYTDLMNTHYAMEAMRRTQDVEDLRPAGTERSDIDWDAALAYVSSLQNRPDTGEDAGGFFYNPSDPKAGTREHEGRVVLRSYGTMTYAGLLSMIYARVDRTDSRVVSALDWAVRHWTTEENPGLGEQGLFYFYTVISRALNAAGMDRLSRPPTEGGNIHWADELALAVCERQHEEGYWVNRDGSYWESDPVLTTAYSLLALQHAMGVDN